MWHLNSGGGAISSSFPSEEKHFHLWHISDNTDNKVRKIEMTIKFGLIPNVIKRLVCLWSWQLFFWKHLSFLSYLLTDRWKKLGIYFDKTTCLWGVRCLLQETAADEGGVLYCPWPRTSTITLCSFSFNVSPWTIRCEGIRTPQQRKVKKKKSSMKITISKLKQKSVCHFPLTKAMRRSLHFLFPLRRRTIAWPNREKQRKTE